MTTDDVRMNWTQAFEYPKHEKLGKATYMRQHGVVFKWNEIDIRYRVTEDDTSHIVWVEGRA